MDEDTFSGKGWSQQWRLRSQAEEMEHRLAPLGPSGTSVTRGRVWALVVLATGLERDVGFDGS